jgi:hypothetical protein
LRRPDLERDRHPKPGVYVIGGRLTITSQATVTGSGVTFPNAGFTVDAQGLVELSAPTEVTYGGIFFFQDRYANQGFISTLTGGFSSTTQTVPFMPIIADQVEITGSVKATAQSSTMDLAYPLPKTESGIRLVN